MIVVDYSQTSISNFMAEIGHRKDASINVNVDLIRHMILNTLRSYRTRFGEQYGELVIACDNRHYWRRDVFPLYKAGRKQAREDSGLDWSAIFEALGMVREEIDQFMPYPVININGAEADDVIGTLAEYSQTSNTEGKIFGDAEPFLIISGDHDFNQLQKFDNVAQYSPAKKKMVKIKEPASHVLMEHIIIGDKGDGVPNILSDDDTFVTDKRQRPIRKTLLAEWKAQSPEDWITAEMAHGYNRNKMLVDLSMTPQDIKDEIVSSYEGQINKSRQYMFNYFLKYKLTGLMQVIQDF
jgi:hypothetical protein